MRHFLTNLDQMAHKEWELRGLTVAMRTGEYFSL